MEARCSDDCDGCEKLGTIRVSAEVRQHPETRIETVQDVTAKYDGLAQEQKEHLYAVFLANDNREIGDKLIGLGGNDAVLFDCQDVVRTAAIVNAGAVILVHNHPSGNAQPTDNDRDATENIHDVLTRLGIQLLDHVIVSMDGSYSMRRHNDGPF